MDEALRLGVHWAVVRSKIADRTKGKGALSKGKGKGHREDGDPRWTRPGDSRLATSSHQPWGCP
eukprot:4276203-Pyramimonas_sp.AAC.2